MSIIEKAMEKLGDKPDNVKTDNSTETGAITQASTTPDTKPAPDVVAEQTTVVKKASPVTGSPSGNPKLEIPLAELSEKGLLTPLTPRSQIAEEFRTIKRPLLRNINNAAQSGTRSNLIMVTSALQGDGKTFNAVNLAISIAMEQDKTVLFIDADVAKASAGRMLGVPEDKPGLIDVLENKGVELKDVILPTNVETLRILPAGNVHARANELLASDSMHELMVELSNRYDDRVIVFDSPPLLMTTEASVLAGFMDQIAFVVSTDETPQEAITEALEHIGEDKIIGMVLNKTHRRRNRLLGLTYGGYGYGKGYGYGYGSERLRALDDDSTANM
jgi:exopolysaccharide/PEP-CTERM locus tyrosine autokinase